MGSAPPLHQRRNGRHDVGKFQEIAMLVRRSVIAIGAAWWDKDDIGSAGIARL
jgi:hypothetical protein